MEELLPTWEAAARRLLAQKLTLDDEINKERGLSVCRPLSIDVCFTYASDFAPGRGNQEDA